MVLRVLHTYGNCAVTAWIKNFKSIIKKKKIKLNKIVLFGKDKLNTIKVLDSKALIDSYVSHEKFVLINNVLRECYEMKEELKNPKSSLPANICWSSRRLEDVFKTSSA